MSIIDLAVSPTTAHSGLDPQAHALRDEVLRRLAATVGKDKASASPRDWFIAAALATRDRVVPSWLASTKRNYQEDRRRVYYLSLEFLIGRLLIDALTNLGLTEAMRAALADLGVDLDALRALEPDAALGNGGLGRLAACFMDSMATLDIAAVGYGIRYDHGLFRQTIKDGWQHEFPEDWLSFGNPWEFARPEIVYDIGFGGHVDGARLADGALAHVWRPAETVEAVAYDTPVVGWRGKHVNTLRLWSARAPDPLRLDAFNAGDYVGAQADQMRAEFDLQGALSQRFDAGGAGVAAAPGIFLRLRLAARPDPPPYEAKRRYQKT